MDRSYRSYIILVSFVIMGLFLVNPMSLWAQASEDSLQDRLDDRLAEDKGRVLTPAEEMIEQLKKRALRKIEGEKRKQLWATKGTIGFHFGYDNNVNTNSERRGDFYNEQYFAYSWVPTFSDYWAGEVGTWYYSDWYFDTQDTTIQDTAFKAAATWYPRGDPTLEFQPGIERAYAYYHDADLSTYIEDKAWLKFKHKFWKKWSQDGKYEFSFKEYDTKQPRTGSGSTSYMQGMALERIKQTVEYNLAFPPLGKTSVKLKQKGYKETSNDAYIDYYDVYSYKVAGELGRMIMKLYTKLESSYERKNYMHRNVSGLNMAQYDDIYTQKLTGYYTLKKGWTLSYTFTHKKSDSNLVTSDYTELTHIAGIYISF